MSGKEVDEVFSSEYFRRSKMLQITSGLWPYQTGLKRKIPRAILSFILFVAMIPLCNGIRIWCDTELAMCCENIAGVLYTISVFLKYWCSAYAENKLERVYDKLAKIWQEITDPDEHKMLEYEAKQAVTKVTGYIAYMTVGGIGFCQVPMIPIVLDYLFPLNQSRQIVLFVRAEFIIDPYENFYLLYGFFFCATCTTLIAASAIDSTYTAVVHQILGIIAIVKYRLHLATISTDLTEDVGLKKTISAIKLHQDALQFVQLMENSYSASFLSIIIATVLFLSVTAVLVLEDLENGSPIHAIRFSAVSLGIIIHLLFITWGSQNLIDKTSDLFLATYTTEWYNMSKKAKTTLRIMMLRCTRPCMLTGGGLYIMDFQNFGSLMKSVASYITVLSSFR